VRDKLIELGWGRRKRPSSGPEDDLRTLVDQLLRLVSDIAVSDKSLKPPLELRERISTLREVVGRGRESAEPTSGLAEATLDACEEFFSRAREHAINREIEFIEIIDALREAVRSLGGGASSFTESMLGATRRFDDLLELDDLQAVKKRIAVETGDLRKRVVEKEESDKELCTRLSSRIGKLQQSLQRAEEDASLDALTGVANRRTFDRALEAWTASFKENRRPFSIAMIDLDDFRKINDTHGHRVGDRVLLVSAQIFEKSIRTGDMVARYGGEEFVVLFRDCPADVAEARLGKILESVSSTRFDYGDESSPQYLRFTASVGLTEFSGGESAANLVKRADEALYDAKKRGKNHVVSRKRSRLKNLFGGKRHAS
jgi:diguanylate cyclase